MVQWSAKAVTLTALAVSPAMAPVRAGSEGSARRTAHMITTKGTTAMIRKNAFAPLVPATICCQSGSAAMPITARDVTPRKGRTVRTGVDRSFPEVLRLGLCLA